MSKKLIFLAAICIRSLSACNNATPEKIVENHAIENAPAKGEKMSRAETEAWIINTLNEYSIPTRCNYTSSTSSDIIDEYVFKFEGNFFCVKYRNTNRIKMHETDPGQDISFVDYVFKLPIKKYKKVTTAYGMIIGCDDILALGISTEDGETKECREQVVTRFGEVNSSHHKESIMTFGVTIATNLKREDQIIKSIDQAFLHLKKLAQNEKEPF